MRIAFLVGKFPIISQTFIINQIIGLIDDGHEVDIYALEGPSFATTIHPQVLEYQLLDRTYYSIFPQDNLILRFITGFKLVLKYIFRYPRAILSTLNILRYGRQIITLRPLFAAIPFLPKRQYDIIHCQFGMYGNTGVLLREMGILEGILISTFRGFDISEYPSRYGLNIYNNLFEKGDFFLTNCEFFRQRLIELGCAPAHIQVHFSSIDCQQFRYQPRCYKVGGPIKIVTVGRFVEKKGIEYGIRAIAQLRRIYPNIEYKIIGDGALRQYFESLIDELALGELVTLLGWKQQKELIEVLDQSHILLAPSVTAHGGDQDAPVNTLKEAMALGLPVIGTRHGGIPELVEDGVSGYLVPERDPEAIASRLIALIQGAEQWPAMGQAGRNQIETHFDMNVLNKELVNIYQMLLNQSPPLRK